MNLSNDEEARIRGAIEAVEPVDVLKEENVEHEAANVWADDLTVNSPGNTIRRKPEILQLMKTKIGLQYSYAERHREAMVIRGDCVVTMGYEVVVPKGNVPDSGKRINRRYTNIYYLEDGGWRLIARQATNVSVQ
jgi:hypothetical protein